MVFGQLLFNMGYLVDRDKNKWGQGFELIMQYWGMLCVLKGLFVLVDVVGGFEMLYFDMFVVIV